MLLVHLTYLVEAQEPVTELSRLAEHLPYEGLDRALPGENAPFVSKSAAKQAQKCIGEAPLSCLFGRTAWA